MNHKSNSKNDKPWLSKVHQQKKDRSRDIGIRAIDALVKEETPVTLKNIEVKSKSLDPKGKGLHPNTIKTNEALYEYYKMHSTTYKIKQRKTKTVTSVVFDESDLRNISPERNLANVRSKYMKLSKNELVERLIRSEQYMANNQKKWVSKHFEQFT